MQHLPLIQLCCIFLFFIYKNSVLILSLFQAMRLILPTSKTDTKHIYVCILPTWSCSKYLHCDGKQNKRENVCLCGVHSIWENIDNKR